MKWCTYDDNGQRHMFGLPVSSLWQGDQDAVLDSFEPENPSLFVPRTLGLGWDLNLGAVAVKAGWIRADDSLPDLAAHIPQSLRRVLQLGPWIGGAAVAAGAVAVARQDTAPVSWSLTGRPKKWAPGAVAAALPAAIAGVVAMLPQLARRVGSVKHRGSESPEALSVASRAELCGVQAMALMALHAAYWAAVDPQRKQPAGAAAPFLWPLVSGGLKIACVRSALGALDAQLRSQ
ncbi:hypothetical protein CCICO_10890 [Corynebacterium ciconiae DSM 44920]|uniref:DUF5808 domain-containing protein n=1 Tax=Corynebacterium ciconiae TaxID=227319 RepID=UPI00036F90C1|nr:DUF5808 domain-containing protein [Corynebacterium ciconiae]WKD62174.1 hypothetical protein CCICO_10890 [Corynebacterium ciconiae DSM 44920]